VRASDITAKKFDTGYHFMLIEIAKDVLNFEAITDQGKVIDSGSLPRLNDEQKKAFAPASAGRTVGTTGVAGSAQSR
jgi:hypothetical protein